MGNLGKDYGRLRGEIAAWKESRRDLLNDVARKAAQRKGVESAVRRESRKSLSERAAKDKSERKKILSDMAAKNKIERRKFESDLKQEVAATLRGYRTALATMAENSKAHRQGFVSGLQTAVHELRQEVASDILDARNAWAGYSRLGGEETAEPKTQRVTAQQPEVGAED